MRRHYETLLRKKLIYGRLSYRICKSGNLLGIVLMIASVESISLLSDFTVRFICAPFFYDGAFLLLRFRNASTEEQRVSLFCAIFEIYSFIEKWTF